MEWEWDEGEPEEWEVEEMWEEGWEAGSLTWVDDIVTSSLHYSNFSLTGG